METPPEAQFLTIPPELRNRVYELLYPRTETRTVELLESDLLNTGLPLPSNALLTTCRQLYAEAKLVYREIWDGTEFTIYIDDFAAVRRVRELDTARLQRVSRVSIFSRRYANPVSVICELRRGVWTFHEDARKFTEGTRLVLLPPCRRRIVEERGFKTKVLTDSRTLYRCVDATDMDAERVKSVKQAVGRKSLRREELVAVMRECGCL